MKTTKHIAQLDSSSIVAKDDDQKSDVRVASLEVLLRSDELERVRAFFRLLDEWQEKNLKGLMYGQRD